MTNGRRSTVKVTILGEEYSIRSDESPEHTRAVAEHVDATIRALMNAGVVVESHKAAILAAMQISSDLFKSREAPAELAERMRAVSAEVRRMLPPQKRLT
ncbi:MAG TPA: cell division protein ZapA [Gemmatimonadaceae bacterium]|jgi:cell division protein ZapA